MRRRSGLSWFELVIGILLIALGIFTFVNPSGMINAVIVLYGLAAVLMGIRDIVYYVKMQNYFGIAPVISMISGIMSIVAGMWLIAYPGAGRWMLAILFPVWFIVHCVSRLSTLNYYRMSGDSVSYYFTLIVNIIGIVLGCILLVRPWITLVSMAYIIGGYLILLGIDEIMAAWRHM